MTSSARASSDCGISSPSAFDVLRCRVGGDVTMPHPSQTRMCRFPASGSSRESFAHSGVSMDDAGWGQRMPL
jgi:hypothetical protein